jgi:drug/metabolite transporter (DMT)-like permease
MWIFITLFAAGCQSMRTAYQNTLALSRSLFGLSLVSVYLVLCWQLFGWVSVEKSLTFWVAATICAIAQVMATYFMLRAFQSSSFALGTLLSKTEAVLAALIGLPLLHYTLTFGAWLGIAFGVLGAVVMSVKWKNIRQVHKDASLLFGLGSGLCFAITSVTASIASHALSGSLITSAGVTLCYVLALQSIILCSIQMVKSKDVLAPFRYELVLSCKVGMLSALGSIGWFTGFALVNPALVKTLGQIEIVGTLYYSKVRFAEKMTKQQWIGGAMIVISVVLVVTSTLK